MGSPLILTSRPVPRNTANLLVPKPPSPTATARAASPLPRDPSYAFRAAARSAAVASSTETPTRTICFRAPARSTVHSLYVGTPNAGSTAAARTVAVRAPNAVATIRRSSRRHNVSTGAALGVPLADSDGDPDGVGVGAGVTDTSGGASPCGGGSLLQATVSRTTASAPTAPRVILTQPRLVHRPGRTQRPAESPVRPPPRNSRG